MSPYDEASSTGTSQSEDKLSSAISQSEDASSVTSQSDVVYSAGTSLCKDGASVVTSQTKGSSTGSVLDEEVWDWANTPRNTFQAMGTGAYLNPVCLDAPRRCHANEGNTALAMRVSELLYPAPTPTEGALSQLMKYEKDIPQLRRAVIAQQKAEELAKAVANQQSTWKNRILSQGSWHEETDPIPLTGPTSLPMPVTISDQESLALFFTHLEGGGTHDVDISKGKQPLEASTA